MTAHRRAAGVALTMGTLLILATAASVLAKQGIAMLDAPPPEDGGGTPIDIGWVVTLPGPDGPERFSGANAVIRVRGASGDRAIGWAVEQPVGSGHYVATVTVPDGGITSIEIGLADPDCHMKACARDAWMLELSDDLSGYPVPAATAVERAVPSQPAPPSQPAVFVPIGAALAALLLAAVFVVNRTRAMRPGHADQR